MSRPVGVELVGLHGGQAVVDDSVVSLVRSDGQDHVTHRRVRLVEHTIIIIRKKKKSETKWIANVPATLVLEKKTYFNQRHDKIKKA